MTSQSSENRGQSSVIVPKMAPRFAPSNTGGIGKSKSLEQCIMDFCLLVLSETFRCSPPPSSLVFIRCNVQMEILCHMFNFQKDLFPSLKSPACGDWGDGSENAYIFLANCGFFSFVLVTAYEREGYTQ